MYAGSRLVPNVGNQCRDEAEAAATFRRRVIDIGWGGNGGWGSGLGGCHVSHVEGGATLRLKEGVPRKDQCISLKVPKIGDGRVGQDRKTDLQ